MKIDAVIEAFSALAQPTRLDVFRTLVKHEPEGLPAGEIARMLAVPHNTMSSHLAILTRAGLISPTRHSRSIVYRVEMTTVSELVLFLLKDCCNGQPELCMPLIQDLSAACAPGNKCCTAEP